MRYKSLRSHTPILSFFIAATLFKSEEHACIQSAGDRDISKAEKTFWLRSNSTRLHTEGILHHSIFSSAYIPAPFACGYLSPDRTLAIKKLDSKDPKLILQDESTYFVALSR